MDRFVALAWEVNFVRERASLCNVMDIYSPLNKTVMRSELYNMPIFVTAWVERS